MIIAVDFDGTIVTHEYPKIGKEIPFAAERVQEHAARLSKPISSVSRTWKT